MNERKYSPFDQLMLHIDSGVKTVFGTPEGTGRTVAINEPSKPAGSLSKDAQTESMRLMRINHTGEVAAQALYQGQALTAKLETVRESMEQAAKEENDHLLWCDQRVRELGGRPSIFNPIFYVGSYLIGATAGLIGDKWSLGFVAETERQVVIHISEHLQRIDDTDYKSRAILEQMRIDEEAHGHHALEAGGVLLPEPVQRAMTAVSKVMTGTTYWV